MEPFKWVSDIFLTPYENIVIIFIQNNCRDNLNIIEGQSIVLLQIFFILLELKKAFDVTRDNNSRRWNLCGKSKSSYTTILSMTLLTSKCEHQYVGLKKKQK